VVARGWIAVGGRGPSLGTQGNEEKKKWNMGGSAKEAGAQKEGWLTGCPYGGSDKNRVPREKNGSVKKPGVLRANGRVFVKGEKPQTQKGGRAGVLNVKEFDGRGWVSPR